MGAKKKKAGQPAAAGEKKLEVDQQSQPCTDATAEQEDQSVLTVGKMKELLGAYNNPS